MLQFRIDFDLDGACGDIYSTESYFLAKQVYIDKTGLEDAITFQELEL